MARCQTIVSLMPSINEADRQIITDLEKSGERLVKAHPLRFATEKGSGGLKPYVLVRARLEALVSRALFYDLVAAGTEEDGWFGVWSCGMFFPMQRAAEIGFTS